MLLPVLLILFAGSCKKGSIETDYNPNLVVANNQVIAERAYSQVFNIFFMVVSDSVLKAEGSNIVYGAHCTYKTIQGIQYIIDYLPNYSYCPDGKKRKGVITASLDKDFHETGAIATLTFSDYGVDSLSLAGDNTISNTGMTMNMQPSFLHEVPSATLTFIYPSSQQSFHWSSEKMFIHAEGSGTSDFNDDVFDITGSSTGSAINGAVFSATITEALGNYFNCRWIRTGISTLNIPGIDVKTGYIDYIGEDTCTNQVIYYFNGSPFYDEFILH
jgi:hypothetical protein